MCFSPQALAICVFAVTIACGTTGCTADLPLPLPEQHARHPYFARVWLDMAPGMPAPWGAAIKEGVDKALPNLDWSWVHNKAAFSFQLEDRPDWYLDLHLTAVDYVLKEVGPQSLTILLNGKEISKKTLDKKGAVFLHFPVSAGPKPEVAPNIAPCEVNAEGTHFCVLLHSIGFSREIK